jgi:two-component system OmpR family response regulator
VIFKEVESVTSKIRKGMDSLGEVDVLADKLCGALTQRSLEHDRAQRLKDRGLSKRPLSIVVIISRIESCVRSSVEPRETVLRVGSLELDLIDRTARRGNRSIDLLPREFQLLKYMMQRSDQVLTRAALLKDVWHYKFVPETNLVNVHMGRLRYKVDGPNEAPMIRNLRGEGFLLSASPALAKSLPGLRGLKQRELTPTNSNNV